MVTVTHRRDNTMATVLTAIVGVFIVCHTPKAALNLYEVGTVGSNFNSLTPWWFWSGATSQILSVYRSWSLAWLSSPATRNSGWRSTSLPTSVTSSSSQTPPSTLLSTPWRFELDVKLTKGPIPIIHCLFRISSFATFYGLGSAELLLSVSPGDIIIPQKSFLLQRHASWRYICSYFI